MESICALCRLQQVQRRLQSEVALHPHLACQNRTEQIPTWQKRTGEGAGELFPQNAPSQPLFSPPLSLVTCHAIFEYSYHVNV